MTTATYWITQLAVAVSAAAGVLEAGKKRFDLFGMILIAFAAALGGGSVRDLLLDRTVFWVADQNYLLVALAAGLATFFAARWGRLPADLFMLPDAAGLALFTVAGSNVALAMHVPWLVASLMGVITGVMGGVLRDVLCNEVPLVMRAGELYATAAWLGALLLIGLQLIGVPEVWASGVTMAFILALRMAAIRFHLTLPSFSARRDD